MNSEKVIKAGKALFKGLKDLPEAARIEALNALRVELHRYSPFAAEPVDCVQWVKADAVTANDYNPNSVAPPEMKLLEHSIAKDGYTQPIVVWRDGKRFEVVDGFHRNRVGKESKTVAKRIKGYLPVVVANLGEEDRTDRIASTIRHNRARGKHKVQAMSDIVIELKRRNWSGERIAKELGMDADEVLRLCQINGLVEAFSDQEFSQAWDIGNDKGVGEEILSDIATEAPKKNGRILHTWDKWECFRAGFYEERPPNEMTQDQGEEAYRDFLADLERFEAALEKVTREWTFSCEHYLTNDRMNRIAWLGQASVAQALGVPSVCRGGYNMLKPKQQQAADSMALKYLNAWLERHGMQQVSYEQALSRTEAELY